MSKNSFSDRVRALESFIDNDAAAFECVEVASDIAKLEEAFKVWKIPCPWCFGRGGHADDCPLREEES